MIIFLVLVVVSTKAQQPKLVLPVGHTGTINDIEFSPDGKYILTASEDGTAKMWDTRTGYLLHNLKGHALWLDMVKFSPDGKYIITVSNDNTVKLWETITGRLLNTLRGKARLDELGNGGIWIYAAFSPDSKYIVTVSNAEKDAGITRIWEVPRGKLIRSFVCDNNLLDPPQFSRDSRSVLVRSGKNMMKNWDILSGKLIKEITNAESLPDSAAYSPDRKFYVTTSELDDPNEDLNFRLYLKEAGKDRDSILITSTGEFHFATDFNPESNLLAVSTGDLATRIYEVPGGRLLLTLSGHMSPVPDIAFSRDGRNLLSYIEDSVAMAWSLATGKPSDDTGAKLYLVRTTGNLRGEQDEIISDWGEGEVVTIKPKGSLAKAYNDLSEVSRDGKYVISAEGTWEKVTRLWDAATGRLIRTLAGHTGVIWGVHFSHDTKMILTYAFDDTARLWETVTGKLLRKFDGHQEGVRSAAFSMDTRMVATTAGDNSVSLWDVRTGKLRYTFFVVDSSDHFGIIPSGYYQASRDCAKLLHYVTPGLQIISFDQLDVKYNRPDKVLEAIGNKDTSLIKSYRRAWEKRITKLRIDTTQFREGYSVPDCDFVNRESIQREQTAEILTLHIKGMDRIYKLDRFNVWINEIPLYGQRGIRLHQRTNNLDTTITITLSQGQNRVEASVTNSNGTESYRMPLLVNYNPSLKQKESLRFIGIGIDQFAAPQYNLQYSSKDIRDLAIKLKEKYKDDISIDTLFNEHVTVDNVKALKQTLQRTSVNDKVIISYSGHGLLSKEYDYFLSTYNINFDKPGENGLPYEELENLLDSIPARKKLMLIDACHSGEIDKDEITRFQAAADSLNSQGTKGGEVRYTGKSQVGMKNSFELMQSLFVDVGKSTGATIISAAAGTQFALERGDLKNGVFTYSILEAIDKNPNIRISELKKIVGERVEQLTNGLQKPTSRNETIMSDWNL